MSAKPFAAEAPVNTFTGCIMLDVLPVSDDEVAWARAAFGPEIEVDRVGRFYIVHRDRPGVALREARVLEAASSFRPSHCEHCLEAIGRGGIYVYDSAHYGPKTLRAVPLVTLEVDTPPCANEAPYESTSEVCHATC